MNQVMTVNQTQPNYPSFIHYAELSKSQYFFVLKRNTNIVSVVQTSGLELIRIHIFFPILI